ncbi:unnamed protein product, partial [marine sediment metagenome]
MPVKKEVIKEKAVVSPIKIHTQEEVLKEEDVVPPIEIPKKKEIIKEETLVKVQKPIEGITTLGMHKMGVTSVAISPNGNYAVSGS